MKIIKFIQKKTIYIIFENFKNILKTTLNVKYHIFSIKQFFKKNIIISIIRLQICFNYKTIKIIRISIKRQKSKKKTNRLKNLLKLLKQSLNKIINVNTVKKRISFVVFL